MSKLHVSLSFTGVLAASLLFTACSSTEVASVPASAIAAASSAAAAAGADNAEMMDVCNQMIEQSMSPDAAIALADSQGYVARVGTIDGKAQPLTTDYRPDRLTLTVNEEAVTACQIG